MKKEQGKLYSAYKTLVFGYKEKCWAGEKKMDLRLWSCRALEHLKF